MSLSETFHIPNQGLVIPGHATTLKEPRETARIWMVEQGASAFRAEQATEPARVELAWWGGEGVGFVNEGHPQAEEVTVVQVPNPKESA